MTRLLLMMALLLTTAQARADSLWDHNGSVMRLEAEGNHRSFVYEVPRAALRAAGVGPGTILFEGVREGNSYRGTARRFSRNCREPLVYAVSGAVESETRIVLTGRRRVFDAQCRPTGEIRTDTLVFDYLRSDGGSTPPPSPLTRFEGTWSSTEGRCDTDMNEADAPLILTIDSQISTWKTFVPGGSRNEPYDWCDVSRARKAPDGSILLDLDCAHPGHSRQGVRLHMPDRVHLEMDGELYFRCE